MRYKLIAADIDGTLVNSKSELTEPVRKAILAALERGIVFTVSTGRPMRGVEWLNALLPADLPFITYNGAVVIMGKSGKVLFEQRLSQALGAEAMVLGAERGAAVFAWVDGELYAASESDKNEIYHRIARIEPIIAESIDKLLQNGADKVVWCDDLEKTAEFQREMKAHFSGRLNCHTSNPKLLEFVDINVSKAKAMERIGELYGIKREEMIAVGDGYNDISMLEYAGLGVAMGNAPQDVKDCADFVTLSNDDDGVAYVIEKFILGEEKR